MKTPAETLVRYGGYFAQEMGEFHLTAVIAAIQSDARLSASTSPYGEMDEAGREVNRAADVLLGRYRHNDPAIAAQFRAERLAKKGRT